MKRQPREWIHVNQNHVATEKVEEASRHGQNTSTPLAVVGMRRALSLICRLEMTGVLLVVQGALTLIHIDFPPYSDGSENHSQ